MTRERERDGGREREKEKGETTDGIKITVKNGMNGGNGSVGTLYVCVLF